MGVLLTYYILGTSSTRTVNMRKAAHEKSNRTSSEDRSEQ